MRKSTLAFFLFVAILVGGTWNYLANKFEQIATEEIIPKIQESEYIHLADANSIKIDKFKFLIEFGNAQILENNSPISLKVDSVEAFYNPFTDHLRVHFGGEKLSFKLADKEYYASRPNNYIEFNRSLLNKEFNKFDVIYSFGETAFFNAATDKKIIAFTEGSLNLSFEKTEKLYNVSAIIDLEMPEGKLDEIHATDNPICIAISNVARQNSENTNNEDCLGLQEKVLQIFKNAKDSSSPANNRLTLKTSVPIRLVDAVVGYYIDDILQVFKESEQLKFDLSVAENTAFSKVKFSYNLSKENSVVNSNLVGSIFYNLKDEVKEQLAGDFASLLIDVVTKLGNTKHKLEQKELQAFIIKLLNADINIDTNIEVDFTNLSDIVVRAQVDNKFGEKEVFVASVANIINNKEIMARVSFESEKFDQAIDYLFSYFGDTLSIMQKIIPDDEDFKSFWLSYNENQVKIKELIFELMQLINAEPNYKLGDPFKFELEFEFNLLDGIKNTKVNSKPYEEYVLKLMEILTKLDNLRGDEKK